MDCKSELKRRCAEGRSNPIYSCPAWAANWHKLPRTELVMIFKAQIFKMHFPQKHVLRNQSGQAHVQYKCVKLRENFDSSKSGFYKDKSICHSSNITLHLSIQANLIIWCHASTAHHLNWPKNLGLGMNISWYGSSNSARIKQKK